MNIRIKPRFPRFQRLQKKYFAFLLIVPLLTVTAIAKIDCPVCGGDGIIDGMQAMENVKLVDIESREVDKLRDACSSYLMYNYDIKLSLTNEGSETAIGFLKMILIDFTEGKVLDTQYTVVEITGETSLDIDYNIWFETGLDQASQTLVNATVLTGDIPDVTCDGTGKVSLNTWLLINQLKSNFQEITRAEKPFASPVGWQWEERIYENE